MSNIFDALNKQQKNRPLPDEDPLIPVHPQQSGGTLPEAGGTERDLEMERLRQRVLLELGPVSSATLVFTGAVDGEGSTTLALLFARELAQAEQRPVLLVDADIDGYETSLSGAMKSVQAPSVGLTDLLLRRGELSQALLATEQPNLHFLHRGGDIGAPLDVIKTEAVRSLFKELERHYAYVIVDTSPVLQAPETSLLGAAADGVVVVIRANRTRREVVQRGLRMLGQGNCRILGAVLNERRYPIPPFVYRRL